VITAPELAQARATAAAISELLKTAAPQPGQILGPAECFIEKLQGKYRQHLLVKSPTPKALREILAAATELLSYHKNAGQVNVDIDPLSLM
jgi:primosomal protein N'